MTFVLTPEQEAFAASLRDLLAAADTPHIAREWAAGRPDPGRKLWRELADLGVWALLVPAEQGGLGAEPADAVVAWETCGYHAVPGPVVETLGVAPRLLAGEPGTLTRIAAGDVIATAALPPEVPRALDADVADVVAYCDGEAVTTPSVRSAGTPVASIDAVRRVFAVPGGGERVADPRPHAFEFGVLGVSAQLIGMAARMLDMATEYAAQRRQYGRMIGSYQAVKHLLADVAMRLEMARPVVYGAAVAAALADHTDAADHTDPAGRTGPAGCAVSTDLVRDTSAAKVAATRAALLAARTALQVHGAVGYTAEHDLGLWLTKTRALAGAWGGTDHHRRRLLSALRGTDVA